MTRLAHLTRNSAFAVLTLQNVVSCDPAIMTVYKVPLTLLIRSNWASTAMPRLFPVAMTHVVGASR